MLKETFDLAGLVREVEVTIAPLALRNRNTLRVQVAEPIGSLYADYTKLRQSLLNLLSNACKFTHQGDVELQVTRAAHNGCDWVCFCVRDSGIAFPPSILPGCSGISSRWTPPPRASMAAPDWVWPSAVASAS